MPDTVDRRVDAVGSPLIMPERPVIAAATRGEVAERLVADRLRAVLAPDILLLDTVKWLLRERGAVRNGEADVVIGDPERGILVLEVKSGEIRRDTGGTWWAGPDRLSRSPFEQAHDNKYALLKKLHELPDWPAGLKPISGHAVAFPDVDLDTMRGRRRARCRRRARATRADRASCRDRRPATRPRAR